jgi:hypothetical protein
MFGSQALETAVGLSFFLGLVAITASGIVETISRATKKRAVALDRAVQALLDERAPAVTGSGSPYVRFKESPAYRDAQAGIAKTILRREQLPNYLSTPTFLDGATTALGTVDERALSRGFDEAMAQLSDTYKRWATTTLLLVSLALCCAANLNAVRVGRTLWQEEAVRTAAVAGYDTCKQKSTGSEECRDAVTELRSDLPVGWTTTLPHPFTGDPGTVLSRLLGYLLTALLSLLGAQFWFDTAGRLVNLRPSRGAPSPKDRTRA